MKTATKKRVITIIALSILICMCYVAISGSVYADQSNRDKFYNSYTLTGNGADDIVSVALAQSGRDYIDSLGYDDKQGVSAEFVYDCAVLAGQEQAFHYFSSGLDERSLANSFEMSGTAEVPTPQKGDIVIALGNSRSDVDYAGIMYNDFTFLAIRVPNLSEVEKYSVAFVFLPDPSRYSNYIFKYYRPNYQNSPPLPGPLAVKGKTIKVNYSKLKKKSQSFKVSRALSISGYKDGLTFKKLKGNKKITINKKTGKVTVKRYLKKKTYKVKVKITAKGADGAAPETVTATFKVRVR